MKSNNTLIAIALLSLILAVASSVLIWGDVGSGVKIGMFAFGFSSGVAGGSLITRRSKDR